MNVPLAYVQLISALASDVDLELPINGIIYLFIDVYLYLFVFTVSFNEV